MTQKMIRLGGAMTVVQLIRESKATRLEVSIGPYTRKFQVSKKPTTAGGGAQTETWFLGMVTDGTGYQYVGLLDPSHGAIKLTPKSAFKEIDTNYLIAKRIMDHVFGGRPLPKDMVLAVNPE